MKARGWGKKNKTKKSGKIAALKDADRIPTTSQRSLRKINAPSGQRGSTPDCSEPRIRAVLVLYSHPVEEERDSQGLRWYAFVSIYRTGRDVSIGSLRGQLHRGLFFIQNGMLANAFVANVFVFCFKFSVLSLSCSSTHTHAHTLKQSDDRTVP